jgi:hypothetical protein
MDRVCYLMLRATRVPSGSSETEVSGVVERLDTGEKRAFATGRELMAFIAAAVVSASNFGASSATAPTGPESAGLRNDLSATERRTS